MKLKLVLSIFLTLIYVVGNSQIKTIYYNQYNPKFEPQLTITDEKIYILSSNGVYLKNINDLNSSTDWNSIFNGIAVIDLVISDKNILATADKFYTNNNLLFKSENNGSTFITYSPNEFSLPVDKNDSDYEYYLNFQKVLQLDYVENSNTLIAIDNYGVYRSEDFSKSWIPISDHYIDSYLHSSLKCSPHNSNIIIYGFDTMLTSIENGKFKYTTDNGAIWNEIGTNFLNATGIAFHPSDPNIIVLAGGNVVKSSDGGHSWDEMINDIHSYDQGGIDDITFDLREGNRLFGTSQGKGMMYSDDFGKTWNEYYPIPTENSKIADFEQYGSKLYILMADYTLYELDLELIDSAVEEVAEDSLSLTISADTLQFSSASEIEQVEIYSADGMLLHSAESNANDGNIDISALSAGVHIAVFTTSDGQTISKKIIK